MITPEDKNLLITEICARIPYGLVCFVQSKNNPKILSEKEKFSYDMLGIYVRLINEESHIVKPYLRPMSSMTEEEQKEYDVFCCEPYLGIDETTASNFIDWLNAHHFDYRDLIEKGLALEASEGMYKEK